MKITIDTKEDSHEEILKALNLVLQILQKSNSLLDSPHGSFFPEASNPSNHDTMNIMNMFNEQNEPLSAAKVKERNQENNVPEISSFLSLINNKEEQNKKKEETQVEYY